MGKHRLKVEIEVPERVYLRARRSVDSIASEVTKYVIAKYDMEDIWLIAESKRNRNPDPTPNRYGWKNWYETHGFFPRSIDELTIQDMGSIIGYRGDNGQYYSFIKRLAETSWRIRSTSLKRCFSRFKTRWDEIQRLRMQ